MKTSTERQVRRLFADSGWQVHSIVHGGHWRVAASRDGGRTYVFSVSVSASDWRAERNLRAALRRPDIHFRHGGSA